MMYKKSEAIEKITLQGVSEFEVLVGKFRPSFAINNRAKSTLKT
jgi:hypothetical protein